MNRPIYLDHQATTPIDPAVLEAMMPYLTDKFGNAASRTHRYGWEAEEAVHTTREQIAALIGAKPEEIVLTSGATESDNLALKGIAWAYRDKGNHIITTTTEHKAVLDSCKALEKDGFNVTYVPVDRMGLVDPDDIRRAMTPRTTLISVMYVNSEIGAIGPLAAIGAMAHEHGVLFHTDAVQGVGKIACNVNDLQVDLMSLSGHKLYGPKGVGALYIRKTRPRRIRIRPLLDGGGHERGGRSGTLNVPGIVGFGKACELAQEGMADEAQRVLRLRERLRDGLFSQLDDIYLNGHPVHRLPGNLNVSFAYVEGESLLMGLNGSTSPIAVGETVPPIAVSSGSACTSATLEPSYVLKALGVGDELAHTSIRFGLGRFNTDEEIDYVAERIVAEVRRLRELSPLYEMAKEGIDLKSVAWQRE